jgi:recombination protein RecT
MTKALTKFKELARDERVLQRFEEVLGEKAAGFIASLTSMVSDNTALQRCTHKSILTSAIKAAVLDLPIEPSVGFAYVVPFGQEATFILGYKGMIQLAIRTGQYESINAGPVYQGEEIRKVRLTGNIDIVGEAVSDEAIGYFAYFKMRNGYEKHVYMTIEEIHEHAKKYSKSYGNPKSAWTTNFGDMARKTVLRRLLSRWGAMSITWIDDDVTGTHPEDEDDPRFQTPEDITIPDFEDVEEPEIADDIVQWPQRPWPPETVKAYLTKPQGNTMPENGRNVLAAQLNTIFDGDKTKRYELFKGLLGYASTKEAPTYVIANALDWLGVEGFNDPPIKESIREARQAHEYALKQLGQQEMEM